MIIQCKQCRTKFRFDETQMEGDGLWMRCSRCRHVFFQDNPRKGIIPPVAPPSDLLNEVPQEKPTGRLSFEPAGDMTRESARDKDVEDFLKDVMRPEPEAFSTQEEQPESQPVSQPERQPISPPISPVIIDPEEIVFSSEEENTDQPEASEEEAEAVPEVPVRKKSRGWKIGLAIWSILVIIIVPLVLSFVVFPQWGERYMQMIRKYVMSPQPANSQSVTAQVKLLDIRQRVMNNYILGTIRIVEGYAVNQADFAIARIKVKAEIIDAYSVVLDERVSFAGNILSEEDLTNLSEEDIVKKLSVPEGQDNANERVVPNGRIPFMLIFTRETPGIIKTTVTIAGAERLL